MNRFIRAGYYSEGPEPALQTGSTGQRVPGLKTGQPKYFVNKARLEKKK